MKILETFLILKSWRIKKDATSTTLEKTKNESTIYSLLICFGVKCEGSALIVEYYVLLTENLTLAEW